MLSNPVSKRGQFRVPILVSVLDAIACPLRPPCPLLQTSASRWWSTVSHVLRGQPLLVVNLTTCGSWQLLPIFTLGTLPPSTSLGELGWGVAAGCAGFLPARQGRHRQRARACRGRGVGRGFSGEGRGNGGPGCGRSREVGWRRCGTSLGKGSQRQSCIVGRGWRGRRIWSRRARW